MCANTYAIERSIVSDTLNTHTDSQNHGADTDPNRRDFIYIATGAASAVAVGALAWPLVTQMGPAADTLAAGSVEIDLNKKFDDEPINHYENKLEKNEEESQRLEEEKFANCTDVIRKNLIRPNEINTNILDGNYNLI